MRIIAGKNRSRQLKTLSGNHTRPTTDRTKEALFSSLSHRLQTGVMVDLFSGSGAMGLEALSRGFNKCYFVDNNAQAIKVIKENIKALNENKNSVVFKSDYKLAISKIQENIDFVFVDPPYGVYSLEMLMEDVLTLNFNDNAIICIECDRNEHLEDRYQNFHKISEKNYGKSKLITFQKEEV